MQTASAWRGLGCPSSRCGVQAGCAALHAAPNQPQVLQEKYADRGLVIQAFPCNQFLHQVLLLEGS